MRKSALKCHLQNEGHFISASMGQTSTMPHNGFICSAESLGILPNTGTPTPQWPRAANLHLNSRLLHSLNLVAIGLSVGYETRLPIGWHCAFVTGWSRYRLGLPSAPLHYGLTWPVGIPTVFQTLVTVPLHSPNGRQMPAVRAVQRGLWNLHLNPDNDKGVSCIVAHSRWHFVIVFFLNQAHSKLHECWAIYYTASAYLCPTGEVYQKKSLVIILYNDKDKDIAIPFVTLTACSTQKIQMRNKGREVSSHKQFFLVNIPSKPAS